MGNEKIRKRTPAFHNNHFKSVLQTQTVKPLHTPLIQHYREIGNQAVQRLLAPGTIQAKLKIGQPNDRYEQEADRVADHVMRMPEGKLLPVNGQSSSVQRKPLCPECNEKEEDESPSVMPKSAGNQTPQITSGIRSQIQSLQGGGQPLTQSARSFFEPRFGRSFANVRVHTDSNAATAAKAINAKAFTKGKDIAFGTGQYSPGTNTGKQLMAHELTHVVQQNASGREILQLNGDKKTQVKVKTERGVTKTPEERKNNFSFTAIVKVPLASGLKLGRFFFLENIKIVPKVSAESDEPISLSEVKLSALRTKVALSLIRMSVVDRTLPRNFGKLTVGATLGAASFLKYKFGSEGGLSAGIGPTLTLESGYESAPLRSHLLTLGGTMGTHASLSLAAESGVSGLFKSPGGFNPLFWAEGTAGITWKRRNGKELSVKLKIAGEAAVDPSTGKVDSTTKAFYYGVVVGGTF